MATTISNTDSQQVDWLRYWRVRPNLAAYLHYVENLALEQRKLKLVVAKSTSSPAQPNSTASMLQQLRMELAVLLTLALAMVHHLRLAFPYEGPLDPLTRLVRYDLSLLFQCDPRLNVMFLCFALQTGFFVYGLYRPPSVALRPLVLVKAVLLDGDTRFFVRKKVRASLKGKKGNQNKSSSHATALTIPIDQLVQGWSNHWHLVLRYFVCIIGTGLAYVEWCNLVWQHRLSGEFISSTNHYNKPNPSYEDLWRSLADDVVRLWWNRVFSLELLFLLSGLATTNFIASTLFFVLTVIIFAQLRMLTSDLQVAVRLRSLGAAGFANFRARHTQVLTLVTSANRLVGRLLLAHFSIYVGLNTYLVSAIYHGEFGPLTTLVLGHIVAFQCLAMVGFHLIAVGYTARIHRPVSSGGGLMRWSAAGQHSGGATYGWSLHTTLRLASYIERYHTDARYGITYGSLETVMTFATFGKCGLFYCQWFMYWYKLFE